MTRRDGVTVGLTVSACVGMLIFFVGWLVLWGAFGFGAFVLGVAVAVGAGMWATGLSLIAAREWSQETAHSSDGVS